MCMIENNEKLEENASHAQELKFQKKKNEKKSMHIMQFFAIGMRRALRRGGKFDSYLETIFFYIFLRTYLRYCRVINNDIAQIK